MATQQLAAGNTISLPAAGDLSAGQFRFVDINTSGQAALVASAGGRGIGVLNNKPSAAGAASEVQIGGIAKVVAGGSVTAGDNVQSDANGAGITAASADHVLAVAVGSADSGDVFEVLLISKHILA